jgi:uncharacterized repeat protein (TIGR01451 family)
MNKNYVRFIYAITLALFVQNIGIAQCDPGTMNADPMVVCDGEMLTFIHNGDEDLGVGNLLQFVLHDNSGTTLGNILDIQDNPEFGYVSGVNYGETYYVSAIAGEDDGTGNVNLAGACLNISAGTPVVFSEEIIFNTNILDVTCNGLADAQVICTPSDYFYTWSNGATGNTIDGLAAGTYEVTITNALGCSKVDLIVINEPTMLNCTIAGVFVLSCDNPSVELEMVCIGGTPPYWYQWSNGATTPTQIVDMPGTYTVVITDANGCSWAESFTVVGDTDVPVVNISGNLNIDCNQSITVLDAGQGIDLVYEWTDDNGNVFSNGSLATIGWAGTYCVTVTSVTSGCSATDCVEVTADGADCGTISGKVNLDENENCQTDNGEIGYENWMVAAIGNEDFYALTDADGNYEIHVLPGDYVVQFLSPNALFDVCDNGIFTTIVDENDVKIVDFQVQKEAECALMSVDISSPFLRRCFNSKYILKYCNEGTLDADDAYIIVTLDEEIEFLEASEDYTDLGNNTYQFDLDVVSVNDCGFIILDVYIPCTVVLGETLCAEAHIYPDEPCEPIDPLWSGASIRLNAECEDDSVRFTIQNVGLDMTEASSFIVIEDGVMFMDEPTEFTLLSMEMLTMSYEAGGSTWVLDAEQVKYHPGASMPLAAIEGCGTDNMGNFSTGFLTQFPEDDGDEFISIECREVIGAWDPNDKNGFPKGYGEEHFIERGQELEYLIRFQNTGTDTAFNIVVEDVLSPYLDITSLRLGASSHPYELDILGSDTLHFIFENIMLPDSNVNEPNSHGFLKFRIAQMPDLDLGTKIFNEAAIYFDFNDPIITNQTEHTLGEQFIVNTTKVFVENVEIKAFPNPFEERTLIQLKGKDFQNLTFELFDLAGKLIERENFEGNEFELDRGTLNSGLYLFQIKAENLLIGTGKLVIR